MFRKKFLALSKVMSKSVLLFIFSSCFMLFILDDFPAAKTKTAIFYHLIYEFYPLIFRKEKGSFFLITDKISATIESAISSGVCAPICKPAGV